MKRLGVSLILVLVCLLGAFAWSFAPRRLPVSSAALGPLPKADPPPEMTLSVLPAGSMQSKAAFAFRGGSFRESREFVMMVALVHHPRGDLLIDAGFGRRVDAHFRMIPFLLRAFNSYTRGTPVADQLAARQYPLTRLAGVVLTHAHWDHVSGLPDLHQVPAWMNADERRFVASDATAGAVMRSYSFAEVPIREYGWDGGPYLGFARSHDFWGDGSVVLVPAPGHTPGSVIVFVNLPSGARYAFVGDLVWQREGIDIPAERPWITRGLVDDDASRVREQISLVARLHAVYPEIHIMPAHDARAAAELPAFPEARH